MYGVNGKHFSQSYFVYLKLGRNYHFLFLFQQELKEKFFKIVKGVGDVKSYLTSKHQVKHLTILILGKSE